MDDHNPGDNYLKIRSQIFLVMSLLNVINAQYILDDAALSPPAEKKNLLIQCAVLYAMEQDGEVVQVPHYPDEFMFNLGAAMMN